MFILHDLYAWELQIADETGQMHRILRAFPACICEKYKNRLNWLITSVSYVLATC